MPTSANAHGGAILANAHDWAVMANAQCWAMAALLGLSACSAPQPKHLVGHPDMTIDQVRAEIQRLQRVEFVGQLPDVDRGGSIAAVSLIDAGERPLATINVRGDPCQRELSVVFSHSVPHGWVYTPPTSTMSESGELRIMSERIAGHQWRLAVNDVAHTVDLTANVRAWEIHQLPDHGEIQYFGEGR